jgi:hypothetical protein
MNFVRKIFDGQVDDGVHLQFTRFGKGEYGGRFVVSFWKTKKIKVKTSFEFANDLVRLCSEFGNCKVSGIVLSKKDISSVMSENNIEGDSKAKRSGLFYQNDIPSQELNGEQLKVLERESYFTLLDLDADDFKLKIKKKLPKPGKSEKKIDGKFCQLEADEKFYSKIKEDLFWDVPDGKKMNFVHKVIVNEIVMPENEKDFAKIRELAKRKGKIIREGDVDGKEIRKEVEFES